MDQDQRQGRRSHRTDQEEFCQLIDYVDDVDLNKKLAQWAPIYKLTRPMAPSVAKPPMRHSKNVYNKSPDCPTKSCISQCY